MSIAIEQIDSLNAAIDLIQRSISLFDDNCNVLTWTFHVMHLIHLRDDLVLRQHPYLYN